MHLYKQTVELQKQVLGDEHPGTIWCMGGLAYSFTKLGRDQEALQLTQHTLEVRKRVLSNEHPDTPRSTNNLFNFYLRDQEALQ